MQPDHEPGTRRPSRSGQPSAGRARGGDRGPDDGRRRRTTADRRFAGFGDGLDHAMCAAYRHALPPEFPVQARIGTATRRIAVVARRPGVVLFCDSAHPGPHRWPAGDEVDPSELADSSA